MDDLQKEILSRIEDVYIDCPDCEYMTDDEQYTCTTCWCEGGKGRLNVVFYLKNHKSLLD